MVVVVTDGCLMAVLAGLGGGYGKMSVWLFYADCRCCDHETFR